MGNKNYISPEALKRIKQVDLLTWFQMTDPGRIKRINHSTYCLTDHDSLKISHGKWYWWSRGFGGGNALDYLIKAEGRDFLSAAHEILETMDISSPQIGTQNQNEFSRKPSEEKPKAFIMPKTVYPTEAIRYLVGRGISKQVIDFFVEQGLISETADRKNVLFLGKNEKGEYKYGAKRSILSGQNFKGECAGSDKTYSFRFLADGETLHVFEAAIDMLSYATIIEAAGGRTACLNLLSLGGIQKQSDAEHLPAALQDVLIRSPYIKKVYLHLDNDQPGITAASQLGTALKRLGIDVINNPPINDKDVNEYLMRTIREKKCKGRERGAEL